MQNARAMQVAQRRRVDDVVSQATDAARPLAEKAFEAVRGDLSKPRGNVVSLPRSSGPNEYTMRTMQQDTAEEQIA